jgi:hypothetical protein
LRLHKLHTILHRVMQRLLAIAWLAVCNPLLDLDETIEVASDQDRDQIHDFADNCPDAHNPEDDCDWWGCRSSGSEILGFSD